MPGSNEARRQGALVSRVTSRAASSRARTIRACRLVSDLASFGGSIQHLDLSYAALSGEALRAAPRASAGF